jgi:ABC-type amino acid transport substrate-binding protein
MLPLPPRRPSLLLLGLLVLLGLVPAHGQDPFNLRLRVGVVDNALPCSDFENGFARGSAVELWELVASSAGLDFEFFPVATPNDAVEEAATGRIDIAVSCLNITPGRLARAEFSTPYREDGLALLTPREPDDLRSTILTFVAEPMIRNTFLLLLIGSLLAALLLWLLSGGFHHRDVVGRNRWHTFFKGWMMLAVGTGIYKMGSPPPSMALVALTNFFRLILLSIFVGTATNLLLEARSPVDAADSVTLREALHQKIGVDADTISEDWLEIRARQLLPAGTNLDRFIQPATGDKDLLELLEQGKVHAILADTARIRYLWSQLPDPENYRMQARTYNLTPQSFLFGRDLPASTRKAIDINLSARRFDGETRAIVGRWSP